MAMHKVIKLNGETENFSAKKVYHSAMKAGAPAFLAKDISRQIESEVYDGMKTTEIFRKVKKMLKRENIQFSLRFSLKEGIKRLGPAGFIFEDFTRKVLSRCGMKIKGNRFLSGRCCNYEIDFLAEEENLTYIGECKYRNNAGDTVDVNVCLKSFAILDDVKDSFDREVKFFIVTNARFTDQALRYAKCKGIRLLGWDYPKDHGLEDMIDVNKLYPITVLPSFKSYQAEAFKAANIMLAAEILDLSIEKLSKKVNIPKKQLESLRREAEALLK